MNGYILKRIDQGGGYVAVPGSHQSYIKAPVLGLIRIFDTREAAEAERCIDNEIIISIDEV